jgi:phage terminase large subunit-like protein
MTGMGARDEPLAIVISTMSPDPHHVMTEIVEEGRNILAGVTTDPAFAPFIFTTPVGADIWAESTWYESNPALGDFRSLDEMRAYAEKARRIPSRETVFRSLYLNIPTVTGEGRFIAPEDWKACAGPVDRVALRGRPYWGGLDLSSTRDLTAFVLYFPDDGGAVLPWFWLPRDGIDKREYSDRVPYQQWADEGLIELTPGQAIGKRYVAR